MVPLFFQTPKGGCSTLILDTLSVLPMFSDGQMKPINYMDVVPITTVAHLVCKPGYKRPRSDLFKDKINCLANGQWDHHVTRCDPVCGEITIGVPFISRGEVTTISNVPWHVGIYEKQRETYVQICGGSIISETVSEWLTPGPAL